jgi:hypothetical protein
MGCRMAVVRARVGVQALLSAMWCKNRVVGDLSRVGMFVRIEVRKNGVSSRIRFHVPQMQAGLLKLLGAWRSCGSEEKTPSMQRSAIATQQSIELLQNTFSNTAVNMPSGQGGK